MEALYGTGVTADEIAGLDRESIITEFLDDASEAYGEREKEIEGMQEGLMRDLERFIVLQVVDVRWREHLENMDYMREGIHLRGMAQKDPLVEYRNEGHVMFQELNRAIREEVVALLFHAQIAAGRRRTAGPAALPEQPGLERGEACSYEHETTLGRPGDRRAGGAGRPGADERQRRQRQPRCQPVVKSEQESIGRNDPCWCGSGKKFKRCHGA